MALMPKSPLKVGLGDSEGGADRALMQVSTEPAWAEDPSPWKWIGFLMRIFGSFQCQCQCHPLSHVAPTWLAWLCLALPGQPGSLGTEVLRYLPVPLPLTPG